MPLECGKSLPYLSIFQENFERLYSNDNHSHNYVISCCFILFLYVKGLNWRGLMYINIVKLITQSGAFL